MSGLTFSDFTKQISSLSYEQTIILMEKMLENLRKKASNSTPENDYKKTEDVITKTSMNSMWEALKNDTW
ncbi:hypothetical protein E4N90_02940 [Treponema denticola]|uniref:hypothetical protein n=1 Tax=Treponema denticola TaxID=158 RepID=UPI0020A4CCFB|nr:hypothetical protein [Treponema denticola]UTD06953.1 hypothetical protein E4N90_02940 [Treponema denticola]